MILLLVREVQLRIPFIAETVAISSYLKENPQEIEYIRKLDLFNVNKTTKDFVKALFEKYGIGIAPVPFNFNKRVND